MRAKGFNLIETLAFIMVMSFSLTGIVSVVVEIIFNSVNPVVMHQAALIGNMYMEEIMAKPFLDPTTSYGFVLQHQPVGPYLITYVIIKAFSRVRV